MFTDVTCNPEIMKNATDAYFSLLQGICRHKQTNLLHLIYAEVVRWYQIKWQYHVDGVSMSWLHLWLMFLFVRLLTLIFFCFASNQLLFCLSTIGLWYIRFYLIFGWNHTGEQDEVHSELQVDWHLARKHTKVNIISCYRLKRPSMCRCFTHV